MPRPADLPENIKALARRIALEASHARFKADSEGLIDTIERILETVGPEAQRKSQEQERLDAERREREEKERFAAEQRARVFI